MKLLSDKLMQKTAYRQNPTKSPNICYSEIQILATSLLERIQEGKIGLPTLNPRHYNVPFPPLAKRQITLALLEMTGFPLAASAKRMGHPLPEISEAHKDYAKAILSAATTAHLTAYGHDLRHNPFQSPKFGEWIMLASTLLTGEAYIAVKFDRDEEKAAQKAAIQSTQHINIPIATLEDEGETRPNELTSQYNTQNSQNTQNSLSTLSSGLSDLKEGLKEVWNAVDTQRLKMNVAALARTIINKPIEKGAFYIPPRQHIHE